MKILIICSKKFYPEIKEIKKKLEKKGHVISLPNSYEDPEAEARAWSMGLHSEFKKRRFNQSKYTIEQMDAVLCLNFDKGKLVNYIGGATFLELYEAFMNGKKIYLYHDIPEGMLYDEISGFDPIIINEDLELIKDEEGE